jgi:hypothetical protein
VTQARALESFMYTCQSREAKLNSDSDVPYMGDFRQLFAFAAHLSRVHYVLNGLTDRVHSPLT